ncbi:MAG: hypothetical protein IKU15_00330 [Clostridia bacterium]|nr:hypothetical protein [Clostridia bacterium]MBR4889748.1 hypothetical protein [Clostridia bacterium]
MKYSEIKLRVIDLLGYPVDECVRLGYTNKIPRAANEALFRVAHSVLPNLREYTIRLTKDVLPARVTMPPDFISFADEQNAYLNGHNFILTNFVGTSGINLTGNEVSLPRHSKQDYLEYTFFYNATYPKIIDDGKNFEVYTFKTGNNIEVNQDNYVKEIWSTEGNNTYDIAEIAGNIIPHYIVGQILSLDDKVRSIAEYNEFEVLLSSIDVHRNERQREYHSVRGWY